MTSEALRFYFNAIEARKDAEFAVRSRQPGWRIYARAAMRRVVRNKRQFLKIVGASS